MSDKRSAIDYLLRGWYMPKKIRLRCRGAMFIGFTSAALLAGFPPEARAQSDSAATPVRSDHYWRNIVLGFGISLLAHESAHVITSLAQGFHPYVALDNGRPTVFSGIDSYKYPHKQFLFSAAGLTTQALIDEAILDIPHSRGGSVERGILAGGIGTTLFYVTLGRNGSVSDISVMARTSSLSKTELSLIFGGFSAIHAIRISRNPAYDHFFVRPTDDGLRIGLRF